MSLSCFGDAYEGNTLEELSGNGFKLIDPDGIFYEKAYDLGVLMQEWVDEYRQDPMKAGKERCAYLHHLTGVCEQAICIPFLLHSCCFKSAGGTRAAVFHVAEGWAEKTRDILR